MARLSEKELNARLNMVGRVLNVDTGYQGVKTQRGAKHPYKRPYIYIGGAYGKKQLTLMDRDGSQLWTSNFMTGPEIYMYMGAFGDISRMERAIKRGN